jgi:hypothetical protein
LSVPFTDASSFTGSHTESCRSPISTPSRRAPLPTARLLRGCPNLCLRRWVRVVTPSRARDRESILVAALPLVPRLVESSTPLGGRPRWRGVGYRKMPSQFFVAAGAIRAVRGVLIRRADAEGSPRRV